MSIARSLCVLLVVISTLCRYADMATLNRVCVVCDGGDCEDKVCPFEKNSCATISNKDDVVVTKGCVETNACDRLNQQTELLQRGLAMASTQDREMIDAILAGVLEDVRKKYGLEDSGIVIDIEELSQWKCESCSGNKCNA